MPGTASLQGELTRRVAALHAVKAGALRMFDPMLAAVSAAREEEKMSEVADLLGRMHGVFGEHREATADHAGMLTTRLTDLGAKPSRAKVAGVGIGGSLRARVGGLNFGAAARDAFVFEHLEIAHAQLIEQLARRIGDETTTGIAVEIRAADESMAGTINDNWTNVLSLALASSGLPVLRPPEPDDG